ncbi:hypothetical protein [Streptomyces sp. NPDC002790]|uniref:hypothetical protein n=1 Tax=Streptomyces sp. NPDC002790 TaxID=3154431 RepID=UPI00332B9F53
MRSSERPFHQALDRADGAHAMTELLDGPEPPDTAFAFSDELSLGAPQCLADRIYSPENAVPAQDLTVAHRLVVRGTA